MEHALPRTWSLCMTSENHGTVGPAGCKFSHAPEKHERVLVVEAPAGTRAPVAEFKGYVDGQPAVTWFDRDNMPRVGTKLFSAPVESPSAPVGASIDTPEFVGLLGAWVSLCAEDEGITEYERLSAKAWAALIAHIDQHVAREVAAQAGQVAVPGKLLEILRDVHDTLESQADSDIDHFEDDDEERECAPVQYAARRVMEVMDLLNAAATSAPRTPEAPAAAEKLYASWLHSQPDRYNIPPWRLLAESVKIEWEQRAAAQLDGGQEGSAT